MGNWGVRPEPRLNGELRREIGHINPVLRRQELPEARLRHPMPQAPAQQPDPATMQKINDLLGVLNPAIAEGRQHANKLAEDLRRHGPAAPEVAPAVEAHAQWYRSYVDLMAQLAGLIVRLPATVREFFDPVVQHIAEYAQIGLGYLSKIINRLTGAVARIVEEVLAFAGRIIQGIWQRITRIWDQVTIAFPGAMIALRNLVEIFEREVYPRLEVLRNFLLGPVGLALGAGIGLGCLVLTGQLYIFHRHHNPPIQIPQAA